MSVTTTQEVFTMAEEDKILANEVHHVPKKGFLPSDIGTDFNFKRKIVWFNLLGFIFLHTMAFYGYYLCLVSAKYATILWFLVMTAASGEGITIGAHRLYSHKSFKAKFGLRLALIILQTVAGQNCMYIWVRDHRQHHKYSDTDADPHNATRGFFFSHIGWLMSRKHPEVIKRGKNVDMSDLEADWLVMFQKEHYNILYLIFAMFIPVYVPIYLWNESFMNSLCISYFARYILLLHVTWSVNSIAHLFGTRPFDKTILPVESKFVSFIGWGEGWHNYHHAFPWDYRAAEFGSKYNITGFIIDVFAHQGWAYDLKQAPFKMIEHRATKKGDGSHLVFGSKKNESHENLLDSENTIKYINNNLKIQTALAQG